MKRPIFANKKAMILYNETVGIDLDIDMEWRKWIVEEHIPRVMATGAFTEYKMYKVLSHDDPNSISYSIQYFSESLKNVVNYLDNQAHELAEAHRQRFLNRHVAFRTILEEVG